MAKTNFVAANKAKNESIENELKNLKTFDSSYFFGKSHLEEDGTQAYLVFQPLNKYFKLLQTENIFHRGNLKNYLTKLLSFLIHLIIALLHRLIILATK